MSEAGNASAVILVPHSDDILASAARHIIGQCTQLPNLLDTVVLLPDLLFAAQFRLRLLQAATAEGHTALLGPHIYTLEQWLEQRVVLDRSVPGRARRELMLVEALQSHPDVFGDSDPWLVSASLVALFDELSLQRVDIPNDAETFTRLLQSAYGIGDRLPPPLGQEATIVHRLWQAWHVQLQAGDMLDPGLAAVARIARLQQDPGEYRYVFIGDDSPSYAGMACTRQLLQAGRATCFLYDSKERPDSAGPSLGQMLADVSPAGPAAAAQPAREQCLDSIFSAGDACLAERAAALGRTLDTSPLSGQVAVFAAASAEQEARAIDLQVRRWLLAGRQSIGIVTEDRRLARRVRALLERARVPLDDPGGWALSTTSAAAALERWLETVEEDFAHQPLLDTLKSPFVFPNDDREELANIVFRFETDIIRRENIARGLQRYRQAIDRRLSHLDTDWTAESAAGTRVLLNRLDQAADPLRSLLGDDAATPLQLLLALRESMTALGLWQAFTGDPAGQRVLHEWQLLHDAASHTDITLSWNGFRRWLGTALERHDFRPAMRNSPVTLLTLEQARLGQFDALVLGACDHGHLPAAGNTSPFFNDSVRGELGLPVWQTLHAVQLNRFRRLLAGTPQVLMTWQRYDNGEVRNPSAWLELLTTFHEQGWADDLRDRTLEELLEHPAARVAGSNGLPLPAPSAWPAAVLPAARLPKTLSVSAHETLVDCPYRFYAGTGLGLRAREDVREAFEKAEFGTLVHRSLQVFHQGHADFPPPPRMPLDPSREQSACAQLEAISRKVFSAELDDNFEHRAWLARWLQTIPSYIRWLTGHQRSWTFVAAEQKRSLPLAPDRALEGRLDRIDRGADGELVIDYKTGRMPKQHEVDSGEAVQLPSYAILEDTLPACVSYLGVDGETKPGALLQDEALAALSRAVRERLVRMLAAVEAGTPLPAWGDNRTCRYCDFDGLCRRQAWTEDPRA